MVSASRGDFLDCAPLEESLGDLDPMSAEALNGGKASKDTLNGFPFNSAAGGQSMLNSYGRLGGSDLRSELRSDVLVGEQGSSEETGLLPPSMELDQLQVLQLASLTTHHPTMETRDRHTRPSHKNGKKSTVGVTELCIHGAMEFLFNT